VAAIALLIPVLAVALTVLAISLVLWLARRAWADDGGPGARAARRHELLVTIGAAVVAAAVAVGLAAQPVTWPDWAPAPGVLQALTPFAVATVFALARTLGELTWPRPHGTVRSVPLTRRTPWSIGGTRLRWVLATGAATAAVLIATGLTADATGRAIARSSWDLDGNQVTTAAGPYPGWPYGSVMLAGLAVTVAATWLALRTITRRAPLSHLPAPHDDAVRRTSAARLLATVQLCLGATLGITAFMSGSAIRSVSTNSQINGLAEAPAVWLGPAAMTLGALTVVASLAAALLALSSRHVPRTQPDPTFKAVA
jgi:hypothetical protein